MAILYIAFEPGKSKRRVNSDTTYVRQPLHDLFVWFPCEFFVEALLFELGQPDSCPRLVMPGTDGRRTA